MLGMITLRVVRQGLATVAPLPAATRSAARWFRLLCLQLDPDPRARLESVTSMFPARSVPPPAPRRPVPM